MEPRIKRAYADYEVGWISALYVEFAAAQALLDHRHEPLPPLPGDSNTYVLGSIGGHNMVMACLPAGAYGLSTAAKVASDLRRSYPCVRLLLVVGVAGGVPTTTDIRLGDVVIGQSVVQHDLGKTLQGGRFQTSATVFTPRAKIMTALSAMRAAHEIQPNRIPNILAGMLHASGSDCKDCNAKHRVSRPPRHHPAPHIHYGVIASGNQVIKHAGTRDQLASALGALCVEMEGAGLQHVDIPFLVIRGISDYADSHKSKAWQPYAAAAAAACASEILSFKPVESREAAGAGVSNAHQPSARKDDQIQSVIESLYFGEMDARQADIRQAHPLTCRWLLNRPEFRNWLDMSAFDQHHGLLWIKGKPGAGKSTLMKFLLSEAQKNMQDKTVISFFFHARGSEIEKSTQGMYQSLLLQLLEKVPMLKCVLDRTELLARGPAQRKWSVVLLQELFEQAVERLGMTPLLCFVDALDECDQDQVRDMVSFLEHLGKLAMSHGITFHLCYASRHYPHITTKFGISLILDGQEGHKQDIANYISAELKISVGKTAQLIQGDLQERASGVFMWVVLVVKILNEKHDAGMTPKALRDTLLDLPRDLHALFRDILRRHDNSRDETVSCLQWILFAARPLTPEELYYATLACSDSSGTLASERDPEETTDELIQRFILSSSKGLAEITRSKVKSKAPSVQFIHQSVPDFLLKEKGLVTIWADGDTNTKGRSHDMIKSCCLRYLHLTHPKLETLSAGPEPHFWEEAASAFPLAEYAAKYVLHHANEAQASGVDQTPFVRRFLSSLSRWLTFYNALAYPWSHYSQEVTLLYLLAERNLAHLAKLHNQKPEAWMARGRERYGAPIVAALATGSYSMVHVFMCTMPSTLGEDDSYVDLALSKAAAQGHLGIVKQLLEPRRPGRRGDLTGPLCEAVRCRHISTAELLLKHGAMVNSKHVTGKTPLTYASYNADTGMIRLLLAWGAHTEYAAASGHTPLRTVVFREMELSVKALLEHGANMDSVDAAGQSSLSLAAAGGCMIAVRLLLRNGAAVNLQDHDGRSPLVHAAMQTRQGTGAYRLSCLQEITKLLLSGGAQVALADHYGRTPLMWAAGKGHDVIAKLLLDAGADPKMRDDTGRTARSWAIERKNTEISKLLAACSSRA
ncbi:uncharacterized protein B0I36DRAFT_232619 [Microdochium trichocladiopsis]|uniref:Nucleoside phosphorylase domain-containing protein n=1 Tax=Microdochium trichocladiopsis TaxID=1682393 RepID=A0A9P9BTC5_9PEZI|nr:uncharacterized protein B0I36DRAFT_232619 [Microdochium trichocladiopsis]KAH7039836.1 hypothetical protein B0I36DRAFT_232619 [Microdochium trichocladiopsis]